MAQCLLSKYTLLSSSLRLGACEQIISSLEGGLQTSIWLLCAMLARGKLELIKQLSTSDFY